MLLVLIFLVDKAMFSCAGIAVYARNNNNIPINASLNFEHKDGDASRM